MRENFLKHLDSCIDNFANRRHLGPGSKKDPISQITCGYDVTDDGWLAIVFDTRPTPQIDGEWTCFIEGNELRLSQLSEAIPEIDEEEKLGEMIRHCLESAFDSGAFSAVSVAKDCILTVEDFNGAWGWSTHADNSSDAYLGSIASKAKDMSEGESLAYWILILNEVAKGTYEEDKWGFLVEGLAFESLSAFSVLAAIPLLELSERWSTEEEFNGDFPEDDIEEYPMQGPIVKALQVVPSCASGTEAEKELLKRILRNSLEVNESRALSGIIPLWTASALSKIFSQYPEPEINDESNRLENPSDYK